MKNILCLTTSVRNSRFPMKIRRGSLTTKIIVLLVTCLSVVIAVSAMVSFFFQRQGLLMERNRHSAVSVERLALSMSSPLREDDRKELYLLAREELKEVGPVSVAVLTADGQTLLKVDKHTGETGATADRSALLTGEHYSVWREIFKDQQRLGTLQIVYDSSPINHKLIRMLVIGTVQALVLIVISSIVLYFGLSRILLAPLAAIYRNAVEFGTGKLSGRITIVSRDELGELAETFNQMAVAIEDKITRLHDSISEVRQLKGSLADIIDSLPSVIAVVDHEGRIALWNENAELFSGIVSSDARGKLFGELLPQFTDCLQQVGQVINLNSPCRKERIQILQENERRYYDLQICPLASEGVGRAVVRIDDVTEHVRIEDIMMQTEKMIMVGGLAAGMAHEINNPLGAIMQNAQNIERRISPGIEANHLAADEVGISLEVVRAYLEKRGIIGFIGHIREAGSRASRIITGMLHFSRKSESRIENADLALVIDRVMELAANDYDMKKSYDFKHIRIVRDYDPSLPPVAITVLEIEQVLLNIIKNAAQAMSGVRQHCEASITVRTRRAGTLALIEITDNGPGMDENVRHRVFEPFFTSKDVGVGTGLGLSVSYAIITNNHQGSIEVWSQPGEGARFTIRLPIRGRS
jgi:PAS domain S-box-containing protein